MSLFNSIAKLKDMVAQVEGNTAILDQITDILEGLANELQELQYEQNELFDHVFELEDALDIEYEEHGDDADDARALDEIIGQYVVECPQCGAEIFIDDDQLDGGTAIVCSKCNTRITID